MTVAVEAAAGSCPDHVRSLAFDLAGRPACLRIVGARLAEIMTPAFAHLREEAAPASPELTIDVWDASEVPVAGPPAAVELVEARMWPIRRGRFVASTDGRYVGHERPGMQAWMDRTTRRIVAHVSGPDAVELPERVRPFHSLIAIWLGDLGLQLTHAGLVAHGDRGILLAGASGAGKTTTALSCLAAGFDYLADDNVAIELAPDGAFLGHSLYSTACVERSDLDRFPEMARTSRGPLPGETKEMVCPHDIRPESVARRATIQAIALPRVAARPDTRLRPATWREAMLALAPSSLLFLPTPAAAGVERLGRLAQSVPRWWLELGGPSTIGARVAEILAAGRRDRTEGIVA